MLKTTESKPDISCYSYNGNHTPEMCPFKDKEHFYCKVKGHTIKVCRKKLKTSKGKMHHTHQLSQTSQENNKTKESNNDTKC